MTQYLRKSFTVPMSGRDPTTCEHGFTRSTDGSCVFCGAPREQVEADTDARASKRQEES